MFFLCKNVICTTGYQTKCYSQENYLHKMLSATLHWPWPIHLLPFSGGRRSAEIIIITASFQTDGDQARVMLLSLWNGAEREEHIDLCHLSQWMIPEYQIRKAPFLGVFLEMEGSFEWEIQKEGYSTRHCLFEIIQKISNDVLNFVTIWKGRSFKSCTKMWKEILKIILYYITRAQGYMVMTVKSLTAK